MDEKVPPARHPVAPAVFAVPKEDEQGAPSDLQQGDEPWPLLEAVLSDFVRASPHGLMADWPRLSQWLPETGSAYPLLFPTDELVRYVADDFQAIIKTPLPQSIGDLRAVLKDVVPDCVNRFMANSGIFQRLPPHATVRRSTTQPSFERCPKLSGK